MSDGILALNFIFNVLGSLFSFISSSWLLSCFFFCNILYLIATIYLNAKNK